MFSPGIGGAARSRLLPASVPFRYFGAALAFHLAGWLMLLAGADELPSFSGGLGPVFSALHLVTLGVLAMTAVGATLQLLPVATRQPVRSVAAAKVVWWLLTPGVALFAAGAALYAPRVMAPGAMLCVIALLVYAWLLAENLRRARGMRVVVAHGWMALAALLGLLASGLAIVARYEHGIALDHAAFASAHLVLAAYGFMGLLALGLSQFLLPMFALSPAPPPRHAQWVLRGAVVAIVLAVIGAFVQPALVGVAALLGLACAVAHVIDMRRALAKRLRPPLGPAFLLMQLSWGALIASLLVAAATSFGWAPPRSGALFVVLLIAGWLLTFLLAVLQRIVPFLASAHAGGRQAGLVSPLAPGLALALHRWCHLAALGALLAAIVLDAGWLARLGAALGAIGAGAFAVFFVRTLLKLRAAPPAASTATA